MSVRHAVLGLLKEEPDHGYHIKRRFDERVGDIWRLNLGQVYQTLQSLEAQKLIARDEPSAYERSLDPSPHRVRYRLTSHGEQVLETWLRRSPARPQAVRDELLIRLLILEPTRRPEALNRIAAQQRVYQKYLVALQRRKRGIPRTGDSAMVARLGIEAAIAHTFAHLKWLDYSRCLLEGQADASLDLPIDEKAGKPR